MKIFSLYHQNSGKVIHFHGHHFMLNMFFVKTYFMSTITSYNKFCILTEDNQCEGGKLSLI